jgi:hypothetical protein
MQTSGAMRRGIAKLYQRHCEERSDEAINLSTYGAMDCFAALAMTVGRAFAGTKKCYPSLNSSYPFAATSSHLARYAGALPL